MHSNDSLNDDEGLAEDENQEDNNSKYFDLNEDEKKIYKCLF